MFPDFGTKFRYGLLSGLLVFLIGSIIINFKNYEKNLDTFVILFAFSLVLVTFFGGVILRYRRLNKMRRESYEESLDEGGIEEGKPLRNLTESEKNYLVMLKTDNAYIDSRSPVFKVQGKALVDRLLKRKEDKRIYYTLNIRGYTFGGDQLNGVLADLPQAKIWPETAVEYSPRTKHVWKIYKVEDI